VETLNLQVRNHQGQTTRDLLLYDNSTSSIKKEKELVDLFEKKWKSLEEHAQAMSLSLQEEDQLMTNKITRNQSQSKKKSKKKKKKKDTMTSKSIIATTKDIPQDSEEENEEETTISSQEKIVVIEQQVEEKEEEMDGEWRKVERKDSNSLPAKDHTKTKSKENSTSVQTCITPTHKEDKNPKQIMTTTLLGDQSVLVPSPPIVIAETAIPIPVPSSSRKPPQAYPPPLDRPSSPSSPSTPSSPSSPSSLKSYQVLDSFFKKSFPIALEMEIDVEHFLMGPFFEMDQNQLDHPLSISQLEMIQEAHLIAYHQINERKVSSLKELYFFPVITFLLLFSPISVRINSSIRTTTIGRKKSLKKPIVHTVSYCMNREP
jgi:hypothetical protein